MATTTTTSGTVVFSNSGAASSDTYTGGDGLTDGSLGVRYLDVMSNDGGGTKTILWSLDNNDSSLTYANAGKTGVSAPTDLLTQDTGRCEATSGDTSALGASIWITSDGKVGYDASSLTPAAKLDLAHLGAGEYLTDTFTYAIRMSNGTLSWTTVTVQLAGINDAPVLSDTTDPTAVTELGDASHQDLSAITGHFSVTDLDVGDTLTASVVGSPVVQLNGVAFTLPSGASALTDTGAFTLAAPFTSNGGPMNVGYSYDPSQANLDFLRAGDSLTVTYTVKINDGHVDSGTQDVTFTITGTNDAPILSDTTDPSAVTEAVDASAQNLVAITGNFSVSDLDVGDTLTPSVVGSPVVELNGVAFALPAGAGALTDSGAFTLTGATSDGGAVDIGYSYDPAAANLDFLAQGDSLTITYTVKVNDGTIDSGTQDVTITITGTNDAPTVSAALTSDASEDDASYTLDLLSGASDPDHGETATLSVTDVTYSVDDGASSSTAPAGVSLSGATLTVDPTDDAFQHLAQGEQTTITVSYNVTDVHGATVPQTETITITGTNDAPVAHNDTGSGYEDSTISGSLASDGTDVDDGAVLTFHLGAPVAGLTLNSDGTYSLDASNAAYQSLAPGATEDVVAHYTVTDEHSAVSNDATLTFTVTGINDAPAGTDNTLTTLEDTAKVLTVTDFGFSDPIDDPANSLLAVKITTLPTAGTLTLSGVAVHAGDFVSASDIAAGNLAFTPAADANGTGYASLTFQVQDDGGTAHGGVDLDQTPNTLTFDVTPVNDAPVGADNTVTTNEDTPYTFAASDFGFSDPNDSPANSLLAVEISTLPAAGALTLNGVAVNAGDFVAASAIASGLLTFTPAANANGAGYASFTFQVQDDGGTANGGVNLDPTPNTMTLNVTAVDDAPSGTSNTVSMLEDNGHTFTVSEFGFSDPNDSPANSLLAVEITTLPTAGALTLSGVAVIAGQFVSASDIAAGHLVFTPAANANGAGYASFTFQVQDDGGTANGGVNLDPTPNTMTLNVTSVNDAPSGANNTVTTNEDIPYTFAASDFGFSDPNDSPANSLLAVKIDTLPAAGALALNGIAVTAGQLVSAVDIAAGHLIFTPAANANGAGYASFTFQVQDNGGTANGGADLDPTPNTITLNVTAVDDAPVNTVPGAQTVDQAVLTAITGLSVADVDLGAGNIQVSLSDLHGNLTLGTTTGLTFTDAQGDHSIVFSGSLSDVNTALASLHYQSDAAFSGGDTLTMTSNDLGNTGAGGPLSDTDTVGITVNATVTNHAPMAHDDVWVVTQQTTVVMPGLAVLGNDTDVDGNSLSVTSVGAAAHGTTSLLADGSIQYVVGNYTGVDSFTYAISDGHGGTSSATVSLSVIAVGNGNVVDTIDLSSYTPYDASYINASGGDDSITGNAGFDILVGGSGNDNLVGGTGNDIIRGGPGNDTMDGGAGNDMLDLSDATSAINFTLHQGDNAGAFWSVNNSGFGLGNPDLYKNFEGVIGSSFADTITGSTGNDTIIGGGGADSLTGNGGNDVFAYRFTSEGGDTITDFTDGGDKIDVSLINSGNGTDGIFAFGGTTATAHGVWYSTSGGVTTVHVDTDGNTGTDEMQISLTGTHALAATDFLL